MYNMYNIHLLSFLLSKGLVGFDLNISNFFFTTHYRFDSFAKERRGYPENGQAELYGEERPSTSTGKFVHNGTHSTLY